MRETCAPRSHPPTTDGGQSPCLPLSIYTILSRRSVRRHNAVAARAYVAIHTDDVASLPALAPPLFLTPFDPLAVSPDR